MRRQHILACCISLFQLTQPSKSCSAGTKPLLLFTASSWPQSLSPRLDMRRGGGAVGLSLGARVSMGCSGADRSPDTTVAQLALLLQRKVCAVEALAPAPLSMHTGKTGFGLLSQHLRGPASCTSTLSVETCPSRKHTYPRSSTCKTDTALDTAPDAIDAAFKLLLLRASTDCTELPMCPVRTVPSCEVQLHLSQQAWRQLGPHAILGYQRRLLFLLNLQ